MKKRRWYAAVLCLVLLCGCESRNAGADVQGEQVQDAGYAGMSGAGPELNYEVEAMNPRVLTDQVGYDSDSTKVVLFLGDGLGSSFHVIDADSGNMVYMGEIEYSGTDPDSGEKVSYGIFSGLVEKGNYYIQTPVIGESYPFTISDSLYTDIFRTACLQYEKLWEDGTAYTAKKLTEDAETISNLLIAFEYYTGIFSDDLGINESGNNIPDLLDMIRKRVDEIRSLEPRDLTYEQLACYSGILAQFAQDYKNFDTTYAQECLTGAQDAFRILERMDTAEQDESYFFYAIAQMYRATGNGNYNTRIKVLLSQGAVEGKMSFFGNVAYMSCKYKVDVELCNSIMTQLMEEAEKISQTSSKSIYLICAEDLQTISENMTKLSLINYVITNHEYVTVQENHLHYLLGRNPEGVSFIYGTGQKNAGTKQCISENGYQNSALIFMMSEIIKEESD